MEIRERIEVLKTLNTDLFAKDFLLTSEKSEDDLLAILDIAAILKSLREKNISSRVFDSGLAVSIFRDQSTRTRFSFASAANLLGLAVQDMDETKSQISHGETLRETAVMISFLSEIIGIRDDMYLGEGNKYMNEVGTALDEAFNKGILPARPPVINLQCDIDHPTQSMADLLHLITHFGSLEALRGKKMVMSWAYSPSYGKPMSVPQGIITLMTRYGMQLTLAHPEGYGLIPETIDMAAKNAEMSGGSFRICHSMEDAIKDADIVYPKSWAPFHIMKERTELLRASDPQGLASLEKKGLAHNAGFKNWEYTREMQNLTKNSNALYMHCLPADISGVSCKEGEVEAGVFEKHRLETYRQAGYKPYVIAAMMLGARFKSVAEILKMILEKKRKRVE